MGHEILQSQDFKLEIAQKIFLCKHDDVSHTNKMYIKKEIFDKIIEKSYTAMYIYASKELKESTDSELLQKMKETTEEKLKELDSKIHDAAENLGETDVRDACLAKAEYLAEIGDRDAANLAYKETESKTPSTGNKIDMIFTKIRLDILYNKWQSFKENLEIAKKLCENGGDWERKNKVKVYEALFHLSVRNYHKAADLFLDATTTFATTELFSFSMCIFYAVITALITLDRVSLKKRVVDAPEILTVIEEVPNLKELLNSFYYCQYGNFFKALANISDQIHQDMFIFPHFRNYLKEIRVAAYSQFLESYKSVTMESMAHEFGIGVNFLDVEISEFIVEARLHAKIDKVAGVIETNRPNTRNALYQQTIKKGDLLLNRIQKLSKIIDLE